MMWEAAVVEAEFGEGGRLTVLSFTWRGRRLRVESHGRQWEEAGRRHCLVMAGRGQVYELRFTPAEGGWQAHAAAERPAAV